MADVFGFSNVKGTGNKAIVRAGDDNSAIQIQVDFTEIVQLFAIYGENGTITRAGRAAINRSFNKMAGLARRRLKVNSNNNKFDNRRSGRNLLFKRKVIVPYAKSTNKDASQQTKGNPAIINRLTTNMTKGVEITYPSTDKDQLIVEIGWDDKKSNLRHIGPLIKGTRRAEGRPILEFSLQEVEKDFDDILNKEMDKLISADSISPFSSTGKGSTLSVGLNDLGFRAAQGVGDFISGV